METLDLDQASKLLKLHPSTVLAKARAGEIPAAKPGKCWVFIDIDLLDWLREQYTSNRQKVSALKKGERTCSLKERKVITGISSLPSKEKQYTDLLEPATKNKRRK